MAGEHVRPGRWRHATSRSASSEPSRAPYRAAAPDPFERGRPALEQSGRYLALDEGWLRRTWRRLLQVAGAERR